MKQQSVNLHKYLLYLLSASGAPCGAKFSYDVLILSLVLVIVLYLPWSVSCFEPSPPPTCRVAWEQILSILYSGSCWLSHALLVRLLFGGASVWVAQMFCCLINSSNSEVCPFPVFQVEHTLEVIQVP
jgi:hypothetical protein